MHETSCTILLGMKIIREKFPDDYEEDHGKKKSMPDRIHVNLKIHKVYIEPITIKIILVNFRPQFTTIIFGTELSRRGMLICS